MDQPGELNVAAPSPSRTSTQVSTMAQLQSPTNTVQQIHSSTAEYDERKKPTQKLWARFESILDSLGELVQETINAALLLKESATLSTLNATAHELDQTLFQLRVWASDMRPSEFSDRMSSAEAFSYLEAFNLKLTETIRGVFDNLEGEAKESLKNLSEEPPSYESLAGGSKRLQGLMAVLDTQKEGIREEILAAYEKEARKRKDMLEIPPHIPILCLDGGGVRSWSSLLILECLMQEISSLKHNDTALKSLAVEDKSLETPLNDPRSERERGDDTYTPIVEPVPRDVFKYIFGTSSGGLIAIMLGRLKMSLGDCKQKFMEYADEIFSHQKKRHKFSLGLLPVNKYHGRTLMRATEFVVGKFDPDPQAEVWKRDIFAAPEDPCKTAVIAHALWRVDAKSDDPNNIGGGPYVFRTYDTALTNKSTAMRNPGSASDAQIWQVARATSATPGLFDPVTVDDKVYVDGGVVSLNPSEQAYWEVLDILRKYGASTKNTVIVSIGAGIVDSPLDPRPTIPWKSSWTVLTKALSPSIKETEQAHSKLISLRDAGMIQYFRFNVPGIARYELDTWKINPYGKVGEELRYQTLQAIKIETEHYLGKKEVKQQLKECAKAILQQGE